MNKQNAVSIYNKILFSLQNKEYTDTHTTVRMNLEDIMLREIIQSQPQTLNDSIYMRYPEQS